MTNALKAALEAFCRMKAPTVAKILRNRGFRYEADICDRLVDAYQYELDLEKDNGLPGCTSSASDLHG